jgi:LysM repeat protein
MSDEQRLPEEIIAAAGPEEGDLPVSRGISAEWRNFLLLCFILLLVVMGVATVRPFIFGSVIPAIMGENITRATLQEDEAEPVKETEESPETVEAVEGAESIEATGSPDAVEQVEPDAADLSPAAESDVAEPVEPADFPTAVPAQTHTVVRGENLTAIARQYDLTVEALIAANDIQNPNQVFAGEILIIPQP